MENSSVGSLVVSLLANVDINESKVDELSLQVSELITNRKIKLIDIIVLLKDYITSEEDTKRKKALASLTSVLRTLKPDQLLKNEVSVVFTFYKSKLQDTVLLKEAFEGLSSLMSMKYISFEETIVLLDFLRDDYHQNEHLAPIRFFTFKILESVYDRWSENLKDNVKSSDLFIKSFINISTGEKDPRNLLTSFALNSLIIQNLPNAPSYAQTLFDILFSYFPITFKPPKNDPYKITNTDLKLALREAISSSSLFAEDAFGNLIDKLSATSPIVKNDTLFTIKACILKFGGKNCLQFWLPIWNGLKFEIMHNSEGSEASFLNPLESYASQGNDESEKSTYEAALDVIKTLSLELADFDINAFNKFFSYILEELTPNFTYSKDLKQSCSILASIASANKATFDKTIDDTLPLFLTDTSEISKLKLLLMNLSFFLDAYITVFGETTITSSVDAETVAQNKLLDYKDEILMILSKALTGNSKSEVTVRTLSIIQFTKMIKMKGYLTKEEIALVIQYLTDTILTDNNKNIYHASLEGLKVISQIYENIVFEVSLKNMLDLLPLDCTEIINYNSDEIIQLETILKIILDFTTSRHILVKESIISLCNKLHMVCEKKHSDEYCFLLLSAIYSLLENNILTVAETDANYIKESVESILLNLALTNNPIIHDDHNLSLLANVVFFINIKSDRKNQPAYLERTNKLFLDDLKIMDNPSRLVIIYTKIISAIDKACDFEEANTIFEKTLELLKSNHASIGSMEKLGYLELLCVLTNKWTDVGNVGKYVDWKDQSFVNLENLVWLSRGLIMKNSKEGENMLDHFIILLKDTKLGSFVSKLFEIFVIDIGSMRKYKGIAWANNVKLLYKQKFFNDIFQVLVTHYRDTSSMEIKCNYLTALSLILKHTPSNLVEPYMNDLLPMLIQALDMPNSEVRVSSLETLKDATDKFGPLITEHIEILVPFLLKLVPSDKYNAVSVKLLALQLLEELTTTIPLNYLLEYKEKVIIALGPILSDKKRIVRRQCIDTRQAYYELGQVPFE
ncbi:hypothetical protein KAFR_0J00900 [Kazachstania africana CBS 2517]|uniref:MMS19 nucleotide excision repair protein n=1 Tax=Kazachstania africana (strain ATCC 22294 / BCRC 22015 / CBS 2517 / CECT 1963 / NBRC 1671 / NRRL Y-8276) TaxID=1071382 RepID=H2B0K8_KAZAF|nr:hypothetical protein KAFR_0J00900 [Kazachstania africana CBS 2517]CCF60158.1 hypothetical protein KAFR_0J00900 [Kazachstania africana CBS 2517]